VVWKDPDFSCYLAMHPPTQMAPFVLANPMPEIDKGLKKGACGMDGRMRSPHDLVKSASSQYGHSPVSMKGWQTKAAVSPQAGRFLGPPCGLAMASLAKQPAVLDNS